MYKVDALIERIKTMADEHHKTPEFGYLFATRFTSARARAWTIHQAYFVRNRRDCWALAMGQAPFNVKREIWLHEQEKLIAILALRRRPLLADDQRSQTARSE